MAIKIAITNEKGGCGKTTTAVNLSSILAERGFTTLLVDGDYQSYSTSYLSLYDEEQLTIHEVMLGAEISEAIITTDYDFDLLPSAQKFEAMEEELVYQKRQGLSYEYIIKNALSSIEPNYDYIIFDCPPNGNKVQENIEAASDYLILPTIPDNNALHTFLVKSKALARVKANINPRLSVLGVLVVCENFIYKNDRLFSGAIKSQPIFHAFGTSIRFTTEMKNALSVHEPINIYKPKSNGNKDYQKFTDEVINLTQEEKNNG